MNGLGLVTLTKGKIDSALTMRGFLASQAGTAWVTARSMDGAGGGSERVDFVLPQLELTVSGRTKE